MMMDPSGVGPAMSILHLGSGGMTTAESPDNGNGVCSVCGDKSAGRHYGVMACYGCKGFFRRTIRSKQSYNCRFQQRCSIDKDQRNACRFCRFQRCLQVGMEITAIRPDRDVIGKQKNPRKRKLLLQAKAEEGANSSGGGGSSRRMLIKGEGGESCLPSPGTESNSSQQEDMLLNFLMEIDLKAGGGGIFSGGIGGHRGHHHHQQFDTATAEPAAPAMELAIGIVPSATRRMAAASMVKPDPDLSLFVLLQNPETMASCREPISPAQLGQPASTQQFAEAMRKYVLMCVDWVNALFLMANLNNPQEKLALLKNTFTAFCTFEQASSTARMSVAGLLPPQQQQAICLCNGTLVPRDVAQQQHFAADTNNLLANNIVGRILDELVVPLRRLQLSEQERVALIALILLDGDARSSLGDTDRAGGGDCCGLYTIKDKLQNALFQHVRERCDQSLNRTSSRFANILLLLPAVAKVSSIYYENVQLAKMFGRQSLDPLLADIFEQEQHQLQHNHPHHNYPGLLSNFSSNNNGCATSTNSTTNSTGSPTPISAGSNGSGGHQQFGSEDFEPLLIGFDEAAQRRQQLEDANSTQQNRRTRRVSSTEMDQLLLAPLFVQQQQKSSELSSPEATKTQQQISMTPTSTYFGGGSCAAPKPRETDGGSSTTAVAAAEAAAAAWALHQQQQRVRELSGGGERAVDQHHALLNSSPSSSCSSTASSSLSLVGPSAPSATVANGGFYSAPPCQPLSFFTFGAGDNGVSVAATQQQQQPASASVVCGDFAFKY